VIALKLLPVSGALPKAATLAPSTTLLSFI
jgi:hypothetical protein